jgi:hypothetical protein
MRLRKLSVVLAVVVLVAGCKAGGDYQGLEYAPNMYHSVAYEPLSQITDPMQGKITNALDKGRCDFYNSLQDEPKVASGTHGEAIRYGLASLQRSK